MPSKHEKPRKLSKEARSLAIDGQYGDLVGSTRFDIARNEAYNASYDDGDVYHAWRTNLNTHLGAIAAAVVDGHNLPAAIWEQQRQIALDSMTDKSVGPFANYVYRMKLGGRPVEVKASEYSIEDLPSGDPDVVATNENIVGLAKKIDDPLTFLEDTLNYAKDRRQLKGSKCEGPENYATALKFFSDKALGSPLLDEPDLRRGKRMVSETLGHFLRIAEKDAPNIVEMTNIYAATHRLPQGMIDKRFSEGIVKHSLQTMDMFSTETINVFLRAMPKLDLSDCGEPAAMAVDLALRKGSKYERTGDLLASLRAVANLPKSPASERAFTTLLDVRSSLEVSSDLDDLLTINRLLYEIVHYVTEDPNDTQRAKQIAEFIRMRAVDLFKNVARSSKADLFRAQQALEGIQSYSRKI